MPSTSCVRNGFDIDTAIQSCSSYQTNRNISPGRGLSDENDLLSFLSDEQTDPHHYPSTIRVSGHQKTNATLDALAPTQSLSQFSPLCECCKSILDLNKLLGDCTPSHSLRSVNQQEMDADIPIRAVLHGWPAVENLYTLDPVWTIMHVADESIWRHCGIVERLAILRVVSSMLRVRQCRAHLRP